MDFIKKLALDHMQSTCYITIEGIGNNVLTPSRYGSLCHKRGNHSFIYFNYGSLVKSTITTPLILWDVLCLFKDMKTNDHTKTSRPKRVRELRDLLKSKLQSPNHEIVVATGVSHGSLIMRAAIMMLMMDPTCDHLMRKLRFYTVGSPQHPHPYFLSKYETFSDVNNFVLNKGHFCNFYHRNDSQLSDKATVLQLFKARMPFGKHRNKVIPYRFDNISIPAVPPEQDTPLMQVDEQMRIVMHYTDFFDVLSPINFHEMHGYHISMGMLYPLYLGFPNINLTMCVQEWTGSQNKATIHSEFTKYPNIRKLFSTPLFDMSISFKNLEHKTLLSSDVDKCDSENPKELTNDEIKQWFSMPCLGSSCLEAKGGSKRIRIYVPSLKKEYSVKRDATTKKPYIMMNRAKTFLSEIKGKYRYMRA